LIDLDRNWVKSEFFSYYLQAELPSNLNVRLEKSRYAIGEEAELKIINTGGLPADYNLHLEFYDFTLYADSNQISVKTKPPAFPWLTLLTAILILAAATIAALIIIRRR